MPTTRASVALRSDFGAWRTSMNSCRTIRSLTSAMPTAATEARVLAADPAWATDRSITRYRTVTTTTTSHATERRRREEGFTASPHDVEQGEDDDPEQVDRV